jgi:hypothetical protein
MQGRCLADRATRGRRRGGRRELAAACSALSKWLQSLGRQRPWMARCHAGAQGAKFLTATLPGWVSCMHLIASGADESHGKRCPLQSRKIPLPLHPLSARRLRVVSALHPAHCRSNPRCPRRRAEVAQAVRGSSSCVPLAPRLYARAASRCRCSRRAGASCDAPRTSKSSNFRKCRDLAKLFWLWLKGPCRARVHDHTHRTCFFPGEQASDHAPRKQPYCVQDCPPRLLRGFERGYQYFERRVPCAVPIQPSWCAGIQWPGACEPRSRGCSPGSAEPYGGGRGQNRRRIEGVAKLLAGCYRRWLRGHGMPPCCVAMFPRMAPGRTHFS